MGGQNPVDPALPATVPGNLSGTLAGAAATLAVGWLASAGYLSIIATALGLPEAAVGTFTVAVVGAGVNYAVTHFSGVKAVQDFYNMIPSTYAEYPPQPSAGASVTNLRTSSGDKVNG